MALKTWLFAFATLYSMLAHAQYLPNFPHSISRLEYINRAHYAWHTEPAIYLYWGNQMDEYDMIGNIPDGHLSVNINFPVSVWNTSFGAMLLAEGKGMNTKVVSDVHAAVKVKLTNELNAAMGVSMGIEMNETFDSNTEEIVKNSPYASSGLAFQCQALSIGSALHYTHIHPNGVFNGKNFTYFADVSYLLPRDEFSWVKPSFIFCTYEGKNYYEMGITAGFNQWLSSGIAYRFNQSIKLYSDIELYKKVTLGLGYYYNFKAYHYLSNGIFEIYFKLKFKAV